MAATGIAAPGAANDGTFCTNEHGGTRPRCGGSFYRSGNGEARGRGALTFGNSWQPSILPMPLRRCLAPRA
jgi:hypothetical protein